LDHKYIFPFLFIFLITSMPIDAEKIAFLPIDHTYIYDVLDDGSVRCAWSTTIIPKEASILYTFSFRGGKTKDYQAGDSLGQLLDADVNEAEGQRTIALLLAGYQVDQPYKFNLNFTWNELMQRNGDRNTLYTSVDVGEPQSATIIVMPPEGARIGTSVVTEGNSSEPFRKETILDRNALVWQTNNTGNNTEISFRANFNYYNARMSLSDNFYRIVLGVSIAVIAALLLGYRKKLPEWASRIKEHI
jgi:hypothetical protein